jgi:hypothetical protein
MPTNAEVGGPLLDEVPHATHGSALLGPQNNATLLACLAFGELPGLVIAIIWVFDKEDTPVLVDDDQEERLRAL